jgi:hypothetical protein
MKRFLFAAVLLLPACAVESTTRTDSAAVETEPTSWCEPGNAYEGAQMPKLVKYNGTIPADPTDPDAVLQVWQSRSSTKQLWLVYSENGGISRFEQMDRGLYKPFVGKIATTGWGDRFIPKVGVNPPPPPPSGTDELAAFFLESAALFHDIPDVAADRVGMPY